MHDCAIGAVGEIGATGAIATVRSVQCVIHRPCDATGCDASHAMRCHAMPCHMPCHASKRLVRTRGLAFLRIRCYLVSSRSNDASNSIPMHPIVCGCGHRRSMFASYVMRDYVPATTGEDFDDTVCSKGTHRSDWCERAGWHFLVSSVT